MRDSYHPKAPVDKFPAGIWGGLAGGAAGEGAEFVTAKPTLRPTWPGAVQHTTLAQVGQVFVL